MYTDNWWWEKQWELLKEAIIILLLLTSNKTIFSQHHENISAWPVYFIINNLNNETCRKQNVPESILFNIIPVKTKNVKAKVYHHSLKIMLKCRVSFNNLPAAKLNAYMKIALEEVNQISLKIECVNR